LFFLFQIFLNPKKSRHTALSASRYHRDGYAI